MVILVQLCGTLWLIGISRAGEFDDAPPKVRAFLEKSVKHHKLKVKLTNEKIADNENEIKEFMAILRGARGDDRERALAMIAKLKKENESLRGLLARWKKEGEQFPIPDLPVEQGLELKQIGELASAHYFRVLQVIDDKTMLLVAGLKNGGETDQFMVKGESTKDVVSNFKFDKMNAPCWEITKTVTYPTALGGTRTVFLAEPFDMAPVKTYLEKRKALAAEGATAKAIKP